nr:MAG TPA: hypothetical protein [Caudoviricetes sp.]
MGLIFMSCRQPKLRLSFLTPLKSILSVFTP